MLRFQKKSVKLITLHNKTKEEWAMNNYMKTSNKALLRLKIEFISPDHFTNKGTLL
ncbi:conserved hypothetical protein [Listeria monocytogenes]|nr:conserved hypothetical protein [Listeria monocytogenes]CUK91930.1 conserved hypothetical protein [Listeria monocytogenes]